MTLPKFIITMDGYFRLGMVNQHKHLLKPGDQPQGTMAKYGKFRKGVDIPRWTWASLSITLRLELGKTTSNGYEN